MPLPHTPPTAFFITASACPTAILHPDHFIHPVQLGKEGKGKKARQGKRLTGRCWMADKFPMSLRQLIPVLDVIGRANKYLARVGKFLQKYGEMDLFPVKLQVCTRASGLDFVLGSLLSLVYAEPMGIWTRVKLLSQPQHSGVRVYGGL